MLIEVMRPRRLSGVTRFLRTFLIIVETESPAPTKARAIKEIKKTLESPKAIVATPYTATAAKSIFPWFFIRGAFAIKRPARTAPTDGAAYKSPRPSGPTFNMSFAKIGRITVAEAKKLEKKSRIIVDQINVLDFTNFSPSKIALTETWDFTPSGSPLFLIRARDVSPPTKEMAFIK